MPSLLDLGLGFALSLAIAIAGWLRASLTAGGVIGAILVGTAVFAFGGLAWAAVMVAFFVLSSALSKVGESRKARLSGVVEKGSQRDLGQVLANGGVAALLALMVGILSPAAVFPAFLGAMAAATADTWSTEIGVLSPESPRSIRTGRVVPPGTSGGVTGLGLLAALAGGVMIGIVAILAKLVTPEIAQVSAGRLLGVAVIAALAGSLADSLLGATVQRVYRCRRCALDTEQRVHRCGELAIPSHGARLMNNDVVNVLGSAVGAFTGLLVAWLA
jgi:uncharacterized protein (TIGR00297 family)